MADGVIQLLAYVFSLLLLGSTVFTVRFAYAAAPILAKRWLVGTTAAQKKATTKKTIKSRKRRGAKGA